MLARIFDKFRTANEGDSDLIDASQPSTPLTSSQAFSRLNQVAPLASEVAHQGLQADGNARGTTANAPQSIICREAILGRDQRVSGYSFMLRNRINERVRESNAYIRGLYDEVLLLNLQAMNIKQLLEHRMAFIAISGSSISLPIIEQLPSNGVVYVISPNESIPAVAEGDVERLRELKARGFKLAVNGSGIDLNSVAGLVAQADFMLIDISQSVIDELLPHLDLARKLAPEIQFVAGNIPTLEDFKVCQNLPFSLFHGPFVTHREEWHARCLDAGRMRTMQLLNKLSEDAGLSELSVLIRQDPALTVRLIRYANSPGLGLLQKSGTIDQALMVLGRQQLHRWFTLLLFAGGDASDFIRPLLENALIRARLAELLAGTRLGNVELQELFLAGMLSLMDIVLGQSMEALLKELGLPDIFAQTLLQQDGRLAPYLKLAIACERHEAGSILSLSSELGIDEKTVNSMHIEAMVWARNSIE